MRVSPSLSLLLLLPLSLFGSLHPASHKPRAPIYTQLRPYDFNAVCLHCKEEGGIFSQRTRAFVHFHFHAVLRGIDRWRTWENMSEIDCAVDSRLVGL